MEVPVDKNHHCAFCSYKSVHKCQIEIHVRQHTGEKPFKCEQCKRGFSVKSQLRLHIRRVHQKLQHHHKCSLCPYATYNRHTLESHTRTHTRERSFLCHHPNCRYAATSPQALQGHIICKHTSERKFVCQVPNCSYRGKTRRDVLTHSVKHTESRPFVCDLEGCSYRGKRTADVTGHKLRVHSGGREQFACPMCNHCTTYKINLEKHISTHTHEKPIKCNYGECTYSCKTTECLKRHVESHHTDKTFKCDFYGCLSTAASRYQLNVHKKRVHSEKVYRCPHCNYRAVFPSILKRHIGRHNANQPIPCPSKGCSFQAKHQESLSSHVRKHKANLDCLLEECGYVGNSRSPWNRHMRLHNPTGRPFQCPLCPKHFSVKTVLSRHLQSHTEEKPFKCPACNYGSINKPNLLRHIRTIHTIIFPEFGSDEKSTCNHCNVNFGCAFGLAMHTVQLRTAVVVLTRLQLK